MTSKPKTRTYIVTVVKKVYAEAVVELPEEGFSAEFAVTTALNDFAGVSVDEAIEDGAVRNETEWQFDTVELVAGSNTFAVII